MKRPQILAYLILIAMCSTAGFCQTKQLTTLATATGMYLDANSTINQATSTSMNHQMLSAAVKAVDLEEILETSGPFTVFAPLDSAFSKFTKEELENLFKSENKRKLRSLLTYHIVAGNLTAARILKAMWRGNGKATFTSVQGNKITATMEGTDIILTDNQGNSAKIISADVGLSNGVIHEIDSVILPSKI